MGGQSASSAVSRTFAQVVDAERRRKGWDVRYLAKEAGLPPDSVHLVVTGHDVRLRTALRVAAALDLDTGDLGRADDLK